MFCVIYIVKKIVDINGVGNILFDKVEGIIGFCSVCLQST